MGSPRLNTGIRDDTQLSHYGQRTMAIKVTRNLGLLLLGLWLSLTGLVPLIGLSFGGLRTLMGLLALGAGVALLFGR
jgi:hypothetical protein